MAPVDAMSSAPRVSAAVKSVRYIFTPGLAAFGSTANVVLEPLGCHTDPDRYTTPFLTTYPGLPVLAPVLAADFQPLIRFSLCHVVPATGYETPASELNC